ncbi:hypothetical protein SAMD00019534_059080 [Acytostelium subglobosum LB1]|uniref:hypothetical protein n=1 Tax=Acytostelium subglobosum LB1 TaxID=1410327 RepID=UPI000644E2DA|nr:hypothetical protein SAMD00019534_059080 [Acytostelium subglobosum LB1]GAM22733.1 hypothetical protein SAMD00019534_059080 [Acytostelium subglobosum LB1]|eukprot:XP_012753960.1 hypothetical protein SAMD00019534_059080 [Acytostelium subglobosum LB1]
MSLARVMMNGSSVSDTASNWMTPDNPTVDSAVAHLPMNEFNPICIGVAQLVEPYPSESSNTDTYMLT